MADGSKLHKILIVDLAADWSKIKTLLATFVANATVRKLVQSGWKVIQGIENTAKGTVLDMPLSHHMQVSHFLIFSAIPQCIVLKPFVVPL